ncbi:hypothetical protein G7Y89_g10571 [Cudoniella acicularis]|uniref:Uncharacterized protein n=1 Tax=Cudoniella acicularis TaxID=354080 RepID=A0A8H4W1H2_9HELO|nr:hypothetical protein G7Y89_g10571 [Cudoniella acicularis]
MLALMDNGDPAGVQRDPTGVAFGIAPGRTAATAGTVAAPPAAWPAAWPAVPTNAAYRLLPDSRPVSADSARLLHLLEQDEVSQAMLAGRVILRDYEIRPSRRGGADPFAQTRSELVYWRAMLALMITPVAAEPCSRCSRGEGRIPRYVYLLAWSTSPSPWQGSQPRQRRREREEQRPEDAQTSSGGRG